MLDEEGNEVRRELTGAWAEARTKLDAAAADLMEAATDGLRTMRLEPASETEADYRRRVIQKRAAKALDHCVERIRVARRYLDMGEPAMAANELICATAYYALALMPNPTDPTAPEPDTWSAAVDEAHAGRGPGPWVRALKTANEQIRALHPALSTQDVRVPACVDQPALRSGPGRMRPVGAVTPAVLEDFEPKVHGKAMRPRRRT